jgi:outer membrane receptor protein involved in Fe transport
MMKEFPALQRLLITTALGGMAWAPQAVAQEQQRDTGTLSEVVVTATRQADTVNHVALNVTAVTQKAIDQSGVQSLQDLARTVPSVTFRRAGGEGNPNISIRGVSSSLGAPTTGIFLDDTPLQKRDNAGSASGNGTPFPQVFDLERVEVLRGPQGTLYGGSAEGGAIRFILPQPSLTKQSVYARTEVSTTEGGGMSYDGGIALGGPIVQDKLGFRGSVYMRHNGGWLDEVSLYDAHTVKKDVNWGDVRQARLALAWAPIDRLKITPSLYYSEEKVNAQDIYWNDIPQFKLNAGTFVNSGTVNKVRFSFPNTFFPGGTFGPYNQFGPGKTGNATYYDTAHTAGEVDSPKDQTLLVGNITIDYGFDKFAVKLISSFENDRNNGYTGGLNGIRTAVLPTATNANFVDSTGKPVPGGSGPTTFIIPGVPYEWQNFNFLNTQHSFAQEVRFSSVDPGARFTWVGGFFYYTSNQHQFTTAPSNEDDVARALRGVDEAWFLGQTNLTDIPGNTSERNLYVTDEEIAGFGEGNYMVTDKLKATVGLRVTRSTIGYNQTTSGSVQGAPPGFVGSVPGPQPYTNLICGRDPLSCNSDPAFHPFPNKAGEGIGQQFVGKQQETPITPKFVVSYQATPRQLYYVSATQGFRAGGLNQPVPVSTCQQDLTALGLTSTPLTYNSDSVWSYEGGAKIGLFDGHAQINSSVFWINWKNPQLSNRLRCGQNFIVNAGEATSKGADIQAQARIGPFTFDASVSYTDAKYTKTYAITGTAGPIIIVNKGDNLGAPDWQANVGVQYNHALTDAFDGYARVDYQYSGKYMRTPGPGASGYDAVIVNGNETRFMTARAGITHQRFDLNVYVNNLTNSVDPIFKAHSSNSALVTAATFRPREVGLQLTYRY